MNKYIFNCVDKENVCKLRSFLLLYNNGLMSLPYDDNMLDMMLDCFDLNALFIDDNCCDLNISLQKYDISNAQSIIFRYLPNINIIPNNFLKNNVILVYVNLFGFSNVTSIGDYFLFNCNALTSIDLSGFSNVTSIGHYFLSNCNALTSIDFSGFSNVTSIGDYFLLDCHALTSAKFPKNNAQLFIPKIKPPICTFVCHK